MECEKFIEILNLNNLKGIFINKLEDVNSFTRTLRGNLLPFKSQEVA